MNPTLTNVSVRNAVTPYGFEFGAATVERVAHEPRSGRVYMLLRTKKHEAGLGIEVTRSGKVLIEGIEQKRKGKQ